MSYGYDFISKCHQKSVECNVLWYCMYVPRYNSVTLSILQRPRQQNEIEMSNLVQIEVDDTTFWIRRKKNESPFRPQCHHVHYPLQQGPRLQQCCSGCRSCLKACHPLPLDKKSHIDELDRGQAFVLDIMHILFTQPSDHQMVK